MSFYRNIAVIVRGRLLLVLAAALGASLQLYAQTGDPGPASAAESAVPSGRGTVPDADLTVLWVQQVLTDGTLKALSRDVPLVYGDQIRLGIDGLERLSAYELQYLTLFLQGERFDKVHPVAAQREAGTIDFKIPGIGGSRPAWKEILKNPPLDGLRRVDVSAGFDKAEVPFPPADPASIPSLTLRLFDGTMLIVFGAAILAVVAFFVWLATKSDIIRDDTLPPLGRRQRKPFSFAKTQAALWFLVIFCSFVFIALVTGDIQGVLNPQALILLGIGAGTTLAAAMVDASKSETVSEQRTSIQASMDRLVEEIKSEPDGKAKPEQEAKLSEMRDAVRPASRNLFLDIVTDKNGITLYRLQALLWTLVLMVIFVAKVFSDLTFPEFDPALLGLMGISSGVYLGFKIPERHFEKPD